MDDLQRFEDFVGLVNALHREMHRILATEAAKLGFKGGDVMALYYLLKHPEGLTAAELARVCDVSRAAMSRTISGLAEAGLVEVRLPGDEGRSSAAARYRAPIFLTPAGIAATGPVDELIQGVLDAVYPANTPEARENMYASLENILAVLKTLSRENQPKGD